MVPAYCTNLSPCFQNKRSPCWLTVGRLGFERWCHCQIRGPSRQCCPRDHVKMEKRLGILFLLQKIMRIEPRMGMDLRVSTWVLQNFWLENPHLKCMIRGYHGLDFLWFFRARIQPPFRAQERGGERRDLRAVVRAPRAQRVSMAMGLPQLDGSKSGKSYENLDDFFGVPPFQKTPMWQMACRKWM